MSKFLIVVDMQKDFVDGALGTEEARAIVPEVVKKVREFDGKVIFTKDTHKENYSRTQEGKKLPVAHCIRGTEGHELIDELKPYAQKAYAVFEKDTFGSRKLAKFLRALNKKKKIESIELIGLCTDICVVSNALMIKGFLPEVPLTVDGKCCAGVTTAAHQAALNVMKSCQVEVTE
ncbi:MAG: cysteine hydrolase [Eubacterium sp.]|nr:cysteine hydrolase [Eubacterium sp.]